VLQGPALEALHDGVVVQDACGRVTAINERARVMLGLATRSGAVSDTELLASFIREDGSPVPKEAFPTMVALQSGEPQCDIVMGIKQNDGSVRWFDVNSVALRRPGDSEPYAAVASLMDITEPRQTSQELTAARLEDLKRLALVSEYRNDETHRHTERVARSTALVAMELGLERELAWTIARAAPLHDVGKVGIPDSVLLKPGKLTAEEFEVMKTHTTIGGRILGESDFTVLRMGKEIALTHHERWHGGGYPEGLSGERIPISGRIVAVTDAFDAMTHLRPYKAAVSVQEALEELRRCCGTQFDPAVVEAFMALDHDTLVDRE
jgi:PAS domain S-box-containing protein